MANPDDTTLPGEDFIDTLAPAPPLPPPTEAHKSVDAPDRLLFFFSGFDPKSATFYHRLFRNGIGQRNVLHDETLALGTRLRIGRWASVWTVLWRGAGAAQGQRPPTMRTRVHFMRWDDIVRRHWRRGPGTLARDYWNVYVRGLFSGVLRRVGREAPAALRLALFPLAVAALAMLAGLGAAAALAISGMLPATASLIVGLLGGFGLWRLVARQVDCEWLLRLYAFTREHAIGRVPALDARLDEMAARLVEAVEVRMRQPGAVPLKEIMVVGYSSGSILAAAVLARAMHRLSVVLDHRNANRGASLSLLTLGQCLPLATEWPQAKRLRAELGTLATNPRLTWHDYSAKSDRAAFADTPPWPATASLKSRQISPKFAPAPGAVEFLAMRRDRREIHLQYLRSTKVLGEPASYDFFELVCGPRTLAERHLDKERELD